MNGPRAVVFCVQSSFGLGCRGFHYLLASAALALVCFTGTRAVAAAQSAAIELLYGDNGIYPSVLLSVKDNGIFLPPLSGDWRLGDPTGLVGVRLVAPRNDCPVTVVLSATALYDRSEVTVRLPLAGRAYRVAPMLRLAHDRLVAIRQPIAGELLRAEVALDGAAPFSLTQVVRVHALNDCLTTLTMGANSYAVGFLAAAFVNEYNPDLLQRITRRALDAAYIDRFDGYDSGDQKQVKKQVEAIYSAIHDLGFQFATIAEASVPSTRGTKSQTIRLNADTLATAQANCVDGTALFAAVLTRINLRAVMFFIPYDHIYLGVYLTPDGPESAGFLAIETTVVGWHPFSKATKLGADRLAKDRKTMPEFVIGSRPLQPFVVLDKLADKLNRGFFKVDIQAAREVGIFPIPEVFSVD